MNSSMGTSSGGLTDRISTEVTRRLSTDAALQENGTFRCRPFRVMPTGQTSAAS